MAKKAAKGQMGMPIISGPVMVESKKDAIAALYEMERIGDFITPYMDRQVELKKAATKYCDDKNIDKVPVGDHHYSLVVRHSRSWNPVKLRKITKGIKIDGKSLWNLITIRVADPELIDLAVKKKWISKSKIEKAFEETPQAPFLQKYAGRAE